MPHSDTSQSHRPDILVFMSDQHTPYFSGYLGRNVDTPALDALVRDGVNFANTYTTCPLCVPARMSMLSGLMPYRTGIYGNNDTLPTTTPTFLHSLVAVGYETTLIGRMHFVGMDQRHGFTQRIAPDMTPLGWTFPTDKLRAQRGLLATTFADPGALGFVGGGESPVIHYDAMVIDKALAYLRKPHQKPQFILVGTYGSHFPYVSSPQLFRKYYARLRASESFGEVPPYMNPLLIARRVPVTADVARGSAAAYAGLVEQMDTQIGAVREAFTRFCTTRGTDRVFCYLSDHGDQVGDRSLFGKDTFFEKSIKIPMMFEGTNLASGISFGAATSILDIGPTLLSLAGAEPMTESDGVCLAESLYGKPPAAERVVLAEQVEGWVTSDDFHYARMAAQGDWKFFTYHGHEAHDVLFNTAADPLERRNLAENEPERFSRLQAAAAATGDPAKHEAWQRRKAVHLSWFRAYEDAVELDDTECWQGNPPSARGELEVSVTGQGVHPAGEQAGE